MLRIIAVVMALLLSPAIAGSTSSSSSHSSGGFSSPRSSSPSSSSGGFSGGSKPSAPSYTAPAPAQKFTAPAAPAPSSGGFSSGSKPATTSVPQMAAPTSKSTAYDTQVNRSISAAAIPPPPPPKTSAAYTPSQVQEKRSTYYTTVYRDRYIPAPAGHSYGSFSEQFMWAMMFNAAFAHNHNDDPSYRQWRRDADERAKSDDKIRQQLAELDSKVKSMEGQPRDVAYVPKDVPTEVVYSDSALQAARFQHEDGSGSTVRVLFWILLLVLVVGGFLFMIRRRII